jgi:hypothetical protein
MKPVKRKAVGIAWDRFPEEIIFLIIVKVAKTSEAPLEDLHSLRLCNKATKRASSSRAITNRFNLEHHYQWFGRVPMHLTHTSKPSAGCKVRTMEEPSLLRGWAAYAQADPVVRHSSHEQ